MKFIDRYRLLIRELDKEFFLMTKTDRTSKNEIQNGAGRRSDYHINNMVATSPIQNTDKARYDALNSIKKHEKKERILVDWISVSLSPLVSTSGFKLVHSDDGNIKVPADFDPDPEFVQLYSDNDYTHTEKIFKRYNNLEVKQPDDFFDWFFDIFNFLDVEKDSAGNYVYEEVGAGKGYNAGRMYKIFSHDKNEGENVELAKLHFRFFDPNDEKVLTKEYRSRSAYVEDPAVANYIRQRISLSLTGNALQALREHDVFFKFIFKLYRFFLEPSVTRFDATLDLFNYGFKPKYFFNLYNKNRYLSRSRMNVVGDADNPTIYIGQFKQSRTLMIYDKVAENKDKYEADEPELLEAVESNSKNTWVRFEQIFTGKQKEATQVFDHLVGDLWLNDMLYTNSDDVEHVFYGRLAGLLRNEFSKKCRFLKKPCDSHSERIDNDKRWQSVLDVLSSVNSDFTFKRPELTLEERKKNFICRSLGGPKLFADILEIEGRDALHDFFRQVEERADEIVKQREEDAV